jgi:hypothetical protein
MFERSPTVPPASLTPNIEGEPAVSTSSMSFRGKCIRLRSTAAVADAIRAAHRSLARGESVYRWCGAHAPFAAPGDLVFPETTRKGGSPATERLEIPDHDARHLLPLKPGRAALLWDKSFLWGYMAVSTLRDLGFSFDLLTAVKVRAGALRRYQLLLVPGGWASLKREELGRDGMEQVRRFVESGGGYLGLCGGAGLALQVDEGLGLLPVARKPITKRLPNFSGSIRVRQTSQHPFWWGLPIEVSFQVWWPSQFEILGLHEILILGRYGRPDSDFCVSDLNVHDVEEAGLDWHCVEKAYEINLDPERLLDEPAALEGRYGLGRVVLSYPHLETPGDTSGNLALFNTWYDLLATSVGVDEDSKGEPDQPVAFQIDEETLNCLRRMVREAEELVTLGESGGLWSWRNSWLLQWKRGIRGSEFGTVFVLLQGLLEEIERSLVTTKRAPATSDQQLAAPIRKLGWIWESFRKKSKTLLEGEARELRRKKSPAEVGISGRVRTLRTELFACVQCYGSKSYGGIYRQLLDQIDALLFKVLRETPKLHVQA